MSEKQWLELFAQMSAVVNMDGAATEKGEMVRAKAEEMGDTDVLEEFLSMCSKDD